ncbi:hypothetical protein J7M02_00450 [Candidatus Aerophobetes bacterium]|nr:hypothetical protein [Candidatus Aerophobetes bacterium]
MKAFKKGLIIGLLIFAGIALGAYVTTLTDTSTVSEPFTAEFVNDLKDNIYPGESDRVIIRVSNSGSANLYAKIEGSVSVTNADPDEDGHEFTEDDVTLTPQTQCLEVPGGGYTDFEFTVSVKPDAEPGEFKVDFTVERVASCE